MTLRTSGSSSHEIVQRRCPGIKAGVSAADIKASLEIYLSVPCGWPSSSMCGELLLLLYFLLHKQTMWKRSCPALPPDCFGKPWCIFNPVFQLTSCCSASILIFCPKRLAFLQAWPSPVTQIDSSFKWSTS